MLNRKNMNMFKKYTSVAFIAVVFVVFSKLSLAVEIRENYKLLPGEAQVQPVVNAYSANAHKTPSSAKADFSIGESWLVPNDTINASNGYMYYYLYVNNAGYKDIFEWDYLYPVIDLNTGYPSGDNKSLFWVNPFWRYMPPDSSNPDTQYWQPYWSFYTFGQYIEVFDSSSSMELMVGYDFTGDFYNGIPGEWDAVIDRMPAGVLEDRYRLCDTNFYLIDDIPPVVGIYEPQDSGIVYPGALVTVSAGDFNTNVISKTELYVDGILVKTVEGTPLEYNWALAPDDAVHILTAKAYDPYKLPLQLGLEAVSKSVIVTNGNIQATQIVALADNGRVVLFSVQNDTVFKAHFNSLNDLAIDQNLPIGISVDFQKQLRFIINLNLECFNFGQPSTWKPTCKYSLDITALGGTELKGSFVGWNGNLTVDKLLGHIDDKIFNQYNLVLDLTFEDPSGNTISTQKINLPCFIFFDKEGGLDYYNADFDGDGKPNWFEIWRGLPQFYKAVFYETVDSRYDPALPDNTPGRYEADVDAKVYKVGPSTASYLGVWLKNEDNVGNYEFNGIHAFAVVCRHENLHKTQFLEWWGSYRNYLKLQPTADPDSDVVPTNVEILLGLNPNKNNSDAPLDDIDDWEEIVYGWHDYWWNEIVEGNKFSDIDYANPGKQTYPQK
ncbi:MAG: Ig-like domain-containing protein [Desulfocucumaceae bacterium]